MHSPTSQDRPSNVGNKANPFIRAIETIIFSSRWCLAVMDLGLVVALVVYSAKFVMVLWWFVCHFIHMDEAETMLSVLGLLDVLMMANLVSMVLIGSYSSFVRKINFADLEDRPQGYSQLNAGMLKVKMASSLVGVSAIHLLKKFIDCAENHETQWMTIAMLIAIHLSFLISLWVLAKVDKITHTEHVENAH